ncbi:hypothetical protein KM043_013727 [Ampulex compressa]|nr:hypothetical protein KM043_013727 [Ampulex compressa]
MISREAERRLTSAPRKMGARFLGDPVIHPTIKRPSAAIIPSDLYAGRAARPAGIFPAGILLAATELPAAGCHVCRPPRRNPVVTPVVNASFLRR